MRYSTFYGLSLQARLKYLCRFMTQGYLQVCGYKVENNINNHL